MILASAFSSFPHSIFCRHIQVQHTEMSEKHSIGRFKCCKKEMTCYYCVSCRMILHRSCTDRKTMMTIRDNKVYCSNLCMNSIENANDGEHEQIGELRNIIAEQQRELKDLTEHFKRTKRNSVAYENEVLEAEETYRKEIEEYKNTIENMKRGMEKNKKDIEGLKSSSQETTDQYVKELEDCKRKLEMMDKKVMEEAKLREQAVNLTGTLRTENQDLRQQIDTLNRDSEKKRTETIEECRKNMSMLESQVAARVKLTKEENENSDRSNRQNLSLAKEIQTLKGKKEEVESEVRSWQKAKLDWERKMKEISDLNRNLLVTVETLEKENEIYSTDIKELKQRLSREQEEVIKNHSVAVSNDDVGQKQIVRRNQLLVIGGENTKGLMSLFKRITNNTFDINSQVVVKSQFAEVVGQCDRISKNFSDQDYVIFFTSDYDAIRGKTISESELDHLLLIRSRTNLIVVGCNFHVNRPVLNSYIYQQNAFIRSYLHGKDAIFIPLIGTSNKDGSINYVIKKELTTFLVLNYISPALTPKDFLHRRSRLATHV